MPEGVVITGVGLITPLGRSPDVVLRRIEQGDRVARPPAFDVSAFDCPVCASVDDFDAEAYFPENKTLRLMNRDARMAVVAAHLAMEDANVRADETYQGEEIALFGAAGLTGMPAHEAMQLVRLSAGPDGSLDLGRFGRVALRRVRPVLSFKLLANMPICFVSIFQGIRGENAIYTPWEGQGALAIASAVRAIREKRAVCALAGGCDVKTHEFAFISLQQLGVFDSWRRHGQGHVPGEGAAFLVLENEERATARRARIYARVQDFRFRTTGVDRPLCDALSALITGEALSAERVVIAAGDGDVATSKAEAHAFREAGIDATSAMHPKSRLGDLFAAAAPVQVALAAEVARRQPAGQLVQAHCFGYGSEQVVFVLEAA